MMGCDSREEISRTCQSPGMERGMRGSKGVTLGLEPEVATPCNQTALSLEGKGYKPTYKTFDSKCVLSARYAGKKRAQTKGITTNHCLNRLIPLTRTNP